MTPNESPPDDIRGSVVRTLTVAARRRDDHGQPVDFAGFLASVLASVAANVGGPDQLLLGRPGSWESGYLGALLEGAMGSDPPDWQELRTEAVVVSLNVAALVESGVHHPGLLGLDDALEVIDRRHATDEDEHDQIAYRQEIDAAITRYGDGYGAYGKSFAAAVIEAASASGLQVSIVFDIDDDPKSTWWTTDANSNPTDWDGEKLIFQLWSYAHDVVPLPNVDIQLAALMIMNRGEDHHE